MRQGEPLVHGGRRGAVGGGTARKVSNKVRAALVARFHAAAVAGTVGEAQEARALDKEGRDDEAEKLP